MTRKKINVTIKQQITSDLKEIIKKLTGLEIEPVLSPSAKEEHGDYSTNIAIAIASLKLKSKNSKQRSPREIAEEIKNKFDTLNSKKEHSDIEKVEIAGPGFLNFFLSNDYFIRELSKVLENNRINKSTQTEIKRFFVEYSQPNTHKAFHIGHLRNVSLGESISRLLEFLGNKVFRATYGSDIGLPVAKALWGVLKLKEEYVESKASVNLRKKAEFLGKAYAKGAASYEEDEKIKEEIDLLNKRIYQKDKELIPLWEETRKWSMDYFRLIYKRVDTKFNKEFWESEVEEKGKKLVLENLGSPREAGKIFVRDQGAIIFEGEKYGLHNRVFITSQGNPTYEGKEMGLALLEEEVFPYDLSLHIVGSEQTEYIRVVFKVIELILPELKGRKKHIPYGMVNLKSGKMSSRKGDVITAEDLIEQTKEKLKQVMKKSKLEANEEVLEKVAVGAVKFSMLKYSCLSDIVFDVEKSIAIDGDSGPYVQYTFARTQSILSKVSTDVILNSFQDPCKFGMTLEDEERAVLRHLEYFQEAVEQAAEAYSPNILALYLLQLARLYNLFYQKYRILNTEKEQFRLALNTAVGKVLKQGLYLLGIEAPDRM